MSDGQLIGFVFLMPIFILFIAVVLTDKVDTRDIVAERKRRIERNGSKSRMGFK